MWSASVGGSTADAVTCTPGCSGLSEAALRQHELREQLHEQEQRLSKQDQQGTGDDGAARSMVRLTCEPIPEHGS